MTVIFSLIFCLHRTLYDQVLINQQKKKNHPQSSKISTIFSSVMKTFCVWRRKAADEQLYSISSPTQSQAFIDHIRVSQLYAQSRLCFRFHLKNKKIYRQTRKREISEKLDSIEFIHSLLLGRIGRKNCWLINDSLITQQKHTVKRLARRKRRAQL